MTLPSVKHMSCAIPRILLLANRGHGANPRLGLPLAMGTHEFSTNVVIGYNPLDAQEDPVEIVSDATVIARAV